MQTDPIRALLQKFQDGYTRRDPAHLDEFMQLFIDRDELEVIGTNAVQPGGGEWCQGPQQVRQLVAGDWGTWGDVVVDVHGAHIFVRGEVAWLATTGTVRDTLPVEQRCDGYLNYVDSVMADETLSSQAKTLAIVKLGDDIVAGLTLSEEYLWPFRFTAVAVCEDGVWRFHHMQFSFATTEVPDVRWDER